jgi:hypothetical protein
VSTAAIAFLTFLGGSAVGAIGAAGVTAWHNSTERLRDRMTAAAEAFLVAVEEAQSALWAEREAAHEVSDVIVEMDALSVKMQGIAPTVEGTAANSSRTKQALASHTRALLMIQRLREATVGQHNPLDTGRRAEVVLSLEAAEEAVRQAEDDFVDTPLAELAPPLRELLRQQSRVVTALQGRGDKTQVFVASFYRVHGAVARVALSFPATESVSKVADCADVVTGLLIGASSAVNQAMLEKSDPFGDAETTRLMRELITARKEFARAANLEIGKRRWRWKKYGH